jgi:hypothetical protein
MRYSPSHVAKIEYADRLNKAFDNERYQVLPSGADDERVDFRGASVIKHVVVQDLHGRSERLTFSDKGRIIAYVPDNPDASRYEFLALLSNGSFQLVDKQGNEVKFTRGGHFEGMITPTASRPVSRIEMGHHRIAFRHTIDSLGNVIIDMRGFHGMSQGASHYTLSTNTMKAAVSPARWSKRRKAKQC